jgi:drug/metabolite transporter (DMT)-like permease
VTRFLDETGRPYGAEIALLCALATLWGTSYTLIKLGVASIPPVTLIAARTLIAGLVLLAMLHVRGIALPRDREVWTRFMIQGCINNVLPFTLIAWAELTVDAGLAVILNATTPIFTFLITGTLTHHEPATLRKLVGVVAGLAGTCLIIGTQVLHGLGDELVAQLALVAATISYAGAAIFGRSFKGLDPMVPAAGSLISGAAVLIPVSILIDQPWTLAPTPGSILALLALAVFCTALAFAIYFRLIGTLGSVATTAQGYLRVPVGIAVGVIFLGETPSATAWIGLVCVVAGVAFMTLPARKRPAPRPA